MLDFVRFGTAPVQVILCSINPSIPYHSNSNSVILLEFVRFGTVACLYKYIDKYMHLLDFAGFSMLSCARAQGSGLRVMVMLAVFNKLAILDKPSL